jgi:hypothetical protein
MSVRCKRQGKSVRKIRFVVFVLYLFVYLHQTTLIQSSSLIALLLSRACCWLVGCCCASGMAEGQLAFSVAIVGGAKVGKSSLQSVCLSSDAAELRITVELTSNYVVLDDAINVMSLRCALWFRPRHRRVVVDVVRIGRDL